MSCCQVCSLRKRQPGQQIMRAANSVQQLERAAGACYLMRPARPGGAAVWQDARAQCNFCYSEAAMCAGEISHSPEMQQSMGDPVRGHPWLRHAPACRSRAHSLRQPQRVLWSSPAPGQAPLIACFTHGSAAMTLSQPAWARLLPGTCPAAEAILRTAQSSAMPP